MKVIRTFVMALFLVFLTGCTNALKEEVDPPITIGFSQSGTESNWRKAHTNSILSALEKNDYEVLYRNGFLNQERQIQDVRTFISYKVDLILLTPLTEIGWESVLKEAKQAGIPVIIVDRNIQTSEQNLYLTHIGPSFKAEGHRAGIFVNNFFSESERTEINILELSGLEDTSPTILRSEGFREWIARDKRMKITAKLYGDFIRLKGKETLENYFIKNDPSDIDLIFSHNDEMTHGALEALKQTDLISGKDIVIVTIDGQNDMIQKLKAGIVNSVVECNPEMGFEVVNVINRYFSGFYENKEIPKEVYIYETIFTQQNSKNIPTRNY